MKRQTAQDDRLQQLKAWLGPVLPGHSEPVPASSDASFRRYFRVFCGDKSWIVMDAPPAQEDCGPFVEVSALLAQAGVRVPEVHARDMNQGFLLLDDLGQETFLSRVKAQGEATAYPLAVRSLLRIQAAPADSLPPYDEALLLREMSLFHDWYLQRHLGRHLDAVEQQGWSTCSDALAETALAQPRVFVHRDYHSRNLMWTEDAEIGVLDFQDAVCGPISYDLVSLLRDCYVSWPESQVDAWCADYHAAAKAAGLPVPGLERFRRDFDWMGVQRHLKAAGIFARLNHRDGKPGYLADIPRTLAYVQAVSARYPELAPLHRLVGSCLD